jgi:hypothetical protein
MSLNLHLFSTPGRNDISEIVEACRPYLEDKDDPVVAYLPLASLYAEKWLGLSKRTPRLTSALLRNATPALAYGASVQ